MLAISWTSPTRRPPRDWDAWGSGAFGASRGSRPHYGVDYVCEPGQVVVAPCACTTVRVRRPYADDLGYSGLLLAAEGCEITLYYVAPDVAMGRALAQGEPVGLAQDITRRYQGRDGQMTPHVHAEVRLVPGVRWPPGWRLGEHFLFRPNRGIYVNPEAL